MRGKTRGVADQQQHFLTAGGLSLTTFAIPLQVLKLS